MSGHSKWHTIRHKKGINDAKRAKVFTQLARAVTVAARLGGGDPEFNFSLRMAIEKAKANNVPKENIERAIKKGTGELGGERIEEKRYEGYAPNGIAVIVDAYTDNANRTVAELKHLFSKHGGNLEGSVSWQFDNRGVILIEGETAKADDEAFVLESVEHGIEDMQTEEQDLILLTEPTKLQQAREWIERQQLPVLSATLEMIPKERIALPPEKEQSVLKLIDAVDDHDDVDRIFHNLETSE